MWSRGWWTNPYFPHPLLAKLEVEFYTVSQEVRSGIEPQAPWKHLTVPGLICFVSVVVGHTVPPTGVPNPRNP